METTDDLFKEFEEKHLPMIVEWFILTSELMKKKQ